MIRQETKYRRRRILALLVLLSLLGGIVFIASSLLEKEEPKPVIPEPKTPPLSYQGFQAGQIISNRNLTDTNSMNAQDIQGFLDDWGYGCKEGVTTADRLDEKTGITASSIKKLDGGRVAVPCLKHYHGNMQSYPADRYCRQEATGGTNLSVAEIISRVSSACQISPQAILVTLQKEQGLITASSKKLTPRRYQIAMGYACPDQQHCDEQFYGLSTQIYYAARQWQRYHRDSEKYDYKAQGTYDMRNGPSAECGTTRVKIENWATASLYNYTPYPPTKDAMEGVFDECNQPGNLQFYAYYRAWFGDPNGNKFKLLTRAKAYPQSVPSQTDK